ncbi:flagellar biosynthesis anti-sigma factor FlgM [Butyrivibrio sp. FCS014]
MIQYRSLRLEKISRFAKQAVNNAPDIREDKVASLKAAIKNGSL